MVNGFLATRSLVPTTQFLMLEIKFSRLHDQNNFLTARTYYILIKIQLLANNKYNEHKN